MARIEGYLSRLAQGEWPSALVIERGGRTAQEPDEWILERPGMEDLGLGDNFHAAKQAVHALLAAERQRRSGSPESPARKEEHGGLDGAK